MKMAHKLFLNFLFIIFFVGACVYLAIHAGQAELAKRIQGEASFLAAQIMDDIDRHIQQRVEEFQIYSKDTVLQEALLKSNQIFEASADVEGLFLQMDRQWRDASSSGQASLVDAILNNRLSEELREKIRFSETKHGCPVYLSVSVTNRYGVNIASTQRPAHIREDKNIWWEKARVGGLYTEDLHWDADVPQYWTDIAIRVDDREGRFAGVVRAALGVEWTTVFLKGVHQQMNRYDRYAGTDFTLLTRDLRVIFSTQEEHLLAASLRQWRPYLWERSKTGHWIGREDFGSRPYKLFAHAHSRGYGDFKGEGWVLVVARDLKTAFGPVNTLRDYWGGILILMIVFAVLLGWYISHTVSRPVIELQQAANQVSHGKLDVHVHFDSKDELGALSRAFNKMVHAVKHGQRQTRQSAHFSALGRIAESIADRINNPLGFVVGSLDSLKKNLWLYREFMSCARSLKESALRNDKDQTLDLAQKMSKIEKDKNWDFLFDDMENLVEETQEGIDRIEKLSRDLRSFVRQDTGKLEMYHIEEIVEIALGAVRDEIRPGVEIKREYALIPSLKCNPQRLGQAFMNILSQRLPALEKGGTLGVKTYVYEENICVQIWDTGRWIPKERIAEIFDPLVDIESLARGAGLGLSVSLDIVQQHGGTIEIESAEDQKTCFLVRLPLRRSRTEGFPPVLS